MLAGFRMSRFPPGFCSSSSSLSSNFRPAKLARDHHMKQRVSYSVHRRTDGNQLRRLGVRCLSGGSSSIKLRLLRKELEKRNADAFIIPTSDPHNSEYAPDCFARRAYISSFSGSAGTAVVTKEEARLWTDGRYFLQAEKELPPDWKLMRMGLKETPSIQDYLADALPKGATVAIDPFVHTIERTKALRKKLEKASIKLVLLDDPNPVDVVWADERPPFPKSSIRVHDLKFSGVSVEQKLKDVRKSLAEKNCDWIIASMLDEVCWLFNIRGDDVPHCTVVLSYALIGHSDAIFYVDPSKVPEDIACSLRQWGIRISDYNNLLTDIRRLRSNPDVKIWMDPSSTSVAILDAAGTSAICEKTPIPLLKACKNQAELNGMKEAHIRDGVALSSFLCWLENYVVDGASISEVDAAEKLREFRAAQPGFIKTAFDTIAGSGPNGAIIHYSPTPENCGNISRETVLLLDSGGQYEDGTTDVTRTMHLGACASEHEKECFTRVLQGHIAIDAAIFPEGTTGLLLDSLARAPLWRMGLDYQHGTGHGVGACLNVHEGPQSISHRIGSNKASIEVGMILSNEPGYYEAGNFGIRIENLLYVVRKSTPYTFGGKAYLGFERLTHVPIDKSMILTNLLSDKEIAWFNDYHAQVWSKLSARLPNGAVKDWLRAKTNPLVREEGKYPATADHVGATIP